MNIISEDENKRRSLKIFPSRCSISTLSWGGLIKWRLILWTLNSIMLWTISHDIQTQKTTKAHLAAVFTIFRCTTFLGSIRWPFSVRCTCILMRLILMMNNQRLARGSRLSSNRNHKNWLTISYSWSTSRQCQLTIGRL